MDDNQSLWEILVPVQMAQEEDFTFTSYANRGHTIPIYTIILDHHNLFDAFIIEKSGGMTILRPATGTWINKGKTERERMIPERFLACYSVAYDIVEFTKKHYKQDMVMCYMLSDKVIMR